MKKIWLPLLLWAGVQSSFAQRSDLFSSNKQLFIDGKTMFLQKNYAGCVDKLEAYKSKQTANIDLIEEADFMIVSSAFEQGLDQASEQLKFFIETYPDTPHADEVYYQIGSLHFKQEDYNRTVYWLEKANIDNLTLTQQEAYSYRLAYSLLQKGEIDRSLGYFARITEIGESYREPASYYVAYINYLKGDYDTAEKKFIALENNPTYRERSMKYLTQIYYIKNREDKVLSKGLELLKEYPDSEEKMEVYRLLGNTYYHQSQKQKAIQYLSKYVTETDTPLRGDCYLLGVCYFENKQYNKAAEMFAKVTTQQDLLTQNTNLYLGQCYLKNNDKNKARMVFEQAATASFDKKVREVALYNYAVLIHETSFSGFGESVNIFEDFLNDYPNSQYADKVNDYLVEVYLTTKNYQSALQSIEKIQRPSSKILKAKQDILFQIGTQVFANNELTEAENLFSRSIEMGAYDIESYYNSYFWRGECRYRQDNYDIAIKDYNSYIGNSPNKNSYMYALAYYNLGYCYFKQKKYDTSLGYFNKYANLVRTSSPTLADAYNRIGDCLFHNREFASAEGYYTKAAIMQPAAGDYAIYQRGFLLGLQKNYQGKITEMDKLIHQYPESNYLPNALFEKGRAYIMQELNAPAAKSFEQLIEQYPQNSLSPKAGIQLGLIYFNENKPEKSAIAYKKVIEKYPNSDEAKVAIQDLKSVYMELNDIAEYANYINSLGSNVHFNITEQDSLTYLAAEKLFMRGNYTQAEPSLNKYLESFPDGAFTNAAHYYLAGIALQQQNKEKAFNYYQQVVASGNSKFMEEALARMADIAYEKKDFTQALTLFKQLQTVAEQPLNQSAAVLGVLRCAQQTKQTADVLDAANKMLKNPKLSPEQEVEARYARALAFIEEGTNNKATADLLFLSKDTRTVQGAEAKYLLAKYYFDSKQDKKCESELKNYLDNPTPHQYWLARSVVLLADLYIRQKDEVQARQYLTYLQNNYKEEDDISEMITERLAKLTK